MTQGPEQQAEANDAVADVVRGRRDRVTGRASRGFASREHQGDDQRGLDDRDREREDQGAEWLADPKRDDLGMMHGRENCRDQGDDEGEQRPAERRNMASSMAQPAIGKTMLQSGVLWNRPAIGACRSGFRAVLVRVQLLAAATSFWYFA